jgi:hypothetical protein
MSYLLSTNELKDQNKKNEEFEKNEELGKRNLKIRKREAEKLNSFNSFLDQAYIYELALRA